MRLSQWGIRAIETLRTARGSMWEPNHRLESDELRSPLSRVVGRTTTTGGGDNMGS